MLLNPFPDTTQVAGSKLKISANSSGVNTESDVVDIDVQIGSLANFGTDIMYERSQVKWDMVVAVERQQEIGAKAIVIVNLDCPS